VAGIALGLGIAFTSSQYLASLVYGIDVTDTLTFTSISVIVALIALAASWLPALRATRVSPVRAMVSE
jgi:putative ABC transport system permease protein